MSLSHCIHQTLNSKASTRFHSGGLQQSSTLILNTFLFGVIILIANILKRAFSSQLAAKLRKIGRAVQQECRDRARMPSSAPKTNLTLPDSSVAGTPLGSLCVRNNRPAHRLSRHISK